MKTETIKTAEAEIERVYGKELAARAAGVIPSKTIQQRITEERVGLTANGSIYTPRIIGVEDSLIEAQKHLKELRTVLKSFAATYQKAEGRGDSDCLGTLRVNASAFERELRTATGDFQMFFDVIGKPHGYGGKLS